MRKSSSVVARKEPQCQFFTGAAAFMCRHGNTNSPDFRDCKTGFPTFKKGFHGSLRSCIALLELLAKNTDTS
jgi:hypothetical protein